MGGFSHSTPAPDQPSQGPQQVPQMAEVADAIGQMDQQNVLNAYNRVGANTNQRVRGRAEALMKNDAAACNYRYQNPFNEPGMRNMPRTQENVARIRSNLISQWNNNLRASGLPYRAEDDGRGQLIVVPLGEGSTGSRGVGVTTESPATSEQTPATLSKAPDVSKPDESTKPEAASDTSKEAPTNVPARTPDNLDGSLHEQFKTLDSAEQQIVTQALTFIEFKDDVHHNQLHLISALTKMDASHRDQIAKQIDQLGKIPDEEAAAGIQKALQNAGLNAQEGHVLAVLIQHHREVFRAPQGEPNAPGEEAVGEVPDKQSLATEAARLHGLPANRINDIRRAGFLLSLAFKGIDISDKENIFSGNPDALKMCRKDDKMWNIIAGLVEVAMALKGEQSDEEKKKESEKEKEKIVAKLERGNKFIQSQTDDQVGIDSDSATGPKKEGNNRYWIGIDGDTNDLRVQFNAETSRWEMKEEDATTWWNPGVDSRPDEWSGSGLAAIKRIENGLKSINEDNEA